MTRYRLVILPLVAAFLGRGVHLTDAVTSGTTYNELPTEDSKEGNVSSPICAQPALLPPPSSVHSLRPGDISVVSAVGLQHSHRATSKTCRTVALQDRGPPPLLLKEASQVLSRLTELLSMFNPDVTTLSTETTYSQHRSLSEEAEEISLSLSHYKAEDWKLVVMFIPTDSLCGCLLQDTKEIDALVQEAKAALQVLKTKLPRTLVHCVVGSAILQKPECACMKNETMNQIHRAALIQILQGSLYNVLASPSWFSEREDFNVVLQSAPLVFQAITHSDESTMSDSSQLAIHLWTNMLQPMRIDVEVKARDAVAFPCPTENEPFLRTQRYSHAFKMESVNSHASPLDLVMGTVMPCTDRSPSPTTPVSVHELRPGDIKVVAALGDSLTAANGAGAKTNNLLLVMNEYRGLSWSIGGDASLDTVTTLPNILKAFNPLLTGFSEGIGNEDSALAFLNQAVAGAKSSDIVRQVHVLVNKMKSDERIDFQNDWKVITVFVGGNDMCDYCTDNVYFSPTNVVARISKALDILHKEVPRAIVNVVELLHMVPLRDLHRETSLACPTWFVKLICPCILNPKEGSVELQNVNNFNRAYQLGVRELVDSGRYDTHDNFTVVLQPFFREVFLPRLADGRPDRSFFAPDCFHLSHKAHTLMARALWNNMLEPVGNKSFTQDFSVGIDLKCPSKAFPFLRTARNSNYTFPTVPPKPPAVTNWGSDFSCGSTAPSHAVPTSVHKLRPADIKVVAALGDSITAGFGAKAKNLIQFSTEYRGVSWSIGGDETLETVTTLPNILRKFNPNIKGMSKGQGKQQSGFNVAVSGAKISGIPGQVRSLIDAMKNNTNVDFQSDWKLVTLFIGGNDLCQYCHDRASLSSKNYSHYMMTSLDILYKEVPRLMVNVLEILEIEGLRKIKRNTLGCNVIQKVVCQCFLEPREDSHELAEMRRVNREYQEKTRRLVYGGRYDGREDFTVVLQPFFRNSIVPLNAGGQPDDTYFSEDCFHFSERGHADMAASLWNNMLEPVGEKQTFNNFTNDRSNIKCPTEERPYIFTNVNSFPIVTTTTTTPVPPTTTTPTSHGGGDGVPVWAAVALAVSGLLIGWGVTWLLLSYRARKSKRKMSTVVELKGTLFENTHCG